MVQPHGTVNEQERMCTTQRPLLTSHLLTSQEASSLFGMENLVPRQEGKMGALHITISGKTYVSLARACKFCIEEGGCTGNTENLEEENNIYPQYPTSPQLKKEV